MDMSVGWYGNVLILFPAALCGILGVILFARMFPWKWLQWLGRNTMILFAWHSRIVIVGCDRLYAFLDLFQSGSLTAVLGSACCTFAAILVLLVPVTLLIKGSRFHSLFGL